MCCNVESWVASGELDKPLLQSLVDWITHSATTYAETFSAIPESESLSKVQHCQYFVPFGFTPIFFGFVNLFISSHLAPSHMFTFSTITHVHIWHITHVHIWHHHTCSHLTPSHMFTFGTITHIHIWHHHTCSHSAPSHMFWYWFLFIKIKAVCILCCRMTLNYFSLCVTISSVHPS